MNGLTSHVLDTSLGRPAAGMVVHLSHFTLGAFRDIARAVTDADGRIKAWPSDEALASGLYRLSFETGAYYEALGRQTFYERVEIQFRVVDASEHHHVPLLLSPFGYSTYRGS